MEVSMEVEDDAFFADLSKQISLLIMDDDDDDHEHPIRAHCPSVSLQALSRAIQPTAQPPFSLYQQPWGRADQSKGTGVFIPQSSHPRRRNRPAKLSSSRAKLHRQLLPADNSRGLLPHASNYNTNFPTSFTSSKP
ncbi:uncharacterized protein LOC127800272 [Diospyros lotus]|uniref:uncharacterized protein LOC127800272 n=1 Tax=Diospyros lotus TaxID=55363 RepID=UPI00224E2874|nr:uncharacterized protein LOC127800272 [Diospyros lotus]